MGRYAATALTYNEIAEAMKDPTGSAINNLKAQHGADTIRQVAQAGPEPPDFMQRMKAGFASDPLSEAQIYQEQGVPASVTPDGKTVTYKTPQGQALADPEGFDFPGDVADLAGEAPATILSILGGVLGGGPITGGAGAVVGGMAGDAIRQKAAQEFGSKRDYDLGQTAVEGAFSLLGEAGGAVASKALKGPLRESVQAPGFQELGKHVERFDVDQGTNLAGTAPLEATVSGDMMPAWAQRLREDDQYGATIRDEVDIPFREEISKAMDKIGQWLPGEGPTAARRSREETGNLLRDAVTSTQKQRRSTVGDLYKAFDEVNDPNVLPDMTATRDAIGEIMSHNIMQRKKSGTAGRAALESALEEASTIDNYKTLQVVRQGIFDEANMAKIDLTKMSKGVQSQFEKLYAALKVDENAFLEAGGGTGSEVARQRGGDAMQYAREMFTADESRFVRRVLGNEEKATNIADMLRNATPEEVKALRTVVGMGSTDIMQQGAQEGVLEATAEGAEAWAALQLEVFKDLRQAAQTTPGQLRQRMVGPERGGPELISGQKLQTALGKFKEGTLEEIFGPAVTGDLTTFASLVKDLTLTESTLANFSNTARASGSMMNDVKDIFMPGGVASVAMARIISRSLSGWIGKKALTTQTGKRLLRGEGRFQNLAPATALETLGRLGGQIGAREYGRDPVFYPNR